MAIATGIGRYGILHNSPYSQRKGLYRANRSGGYYSQHTESSFERQCNYGINRWRQWSEYLLRVSVNSRWPCNIVKWRYVQPYGLCKQPPHLQCERGDNRPCARYL